MESQAAESRYLQNQVAFARPIFLVLALVALAEAPPFPRLQPCVAVLSVYLLAALVLAFLAASDRLPALRLPPLADVILLAGYFCLTPPLTSTIFLYLFVCFASSIYWGLQQTLLLAGVTSLGFLLLRVEMSGPEILPGLLTGAGVAAGTFTAGAGLGFLAERQRRHARESRPSGPGVGVGPPGVLT